MTRQQRFEHGARLRGFAIDHEHVTAAVVREKRHGRVHAVQRAGMSGAKLAVHVAQAKAVAVGGKMHLFPALLACAHRHRHLRSPHRMTLRIGQPARRARSIQPVAHPHEHVVEAATHAAGCRRGDRGNLCAIHVARHLAAAMRLRDVAHRIARERADTAAIQPERCEYFTRQKGFVIRPARCRCHLTGDDVEQIVVGISRTETRRRFQMRQPGQHVGAGKIVRFRPQHQIARPQSQAAVVDQKVAHLHLSGNPGVMHAKVRKMLDDRITPVQFSRIHQPRQQRRRHRLGVGGDLEQRVRCHGGTGAGQRLAIAAREAHFAIFDHADGDAGQVVARHRIAHGGIDDLLGAGVGAGSIDDLLPNTQKIATPQLFDVDRAEAGTAQRLGDVAGLRGIHPAGDATATIEIGGEADMIDTRHGHHVADMGDEIVEIGKRIRPFDARQAIDHRGQVIVFVAVVFGIASQARHVLLQGLLGCLAHRIVLDEFLVGHRLDHAALFRNGAQQLIGQITRMIGQGPRRGVRGDDRRARNGQRIAHAVVRGVRHIHHHPQRIGARHRSATERTHAGIFRAVVRRLAQLEIGHRAAAQIVVADMGQAEIARTASKGCIESIQIVPERIPVLDTDGQAQQTLRMVFAHIAWRERGAHAPWIFCQQHVDGRIFSVGLRHRIGVAFRAQRPLPHVDHQKRGIHAAALHLGQVHLQHAVATRIEMRLTHVIQWNVDVRIQRQRPLRWGACHTGASGNERECGGQAGNGTIHALLQSRAGCSPAMMSSKLWRRRTSA